MNSALYGNTYPVPKQILKKINTFLYTNPTGEGIKRAKNILNSGHVTYQQLKRLKNFFDTFDAEVMTQTEYNFAGGEDMKYFVETTLETERNKSGRSVDLKRPIMSLAGSKAVEAMKAQSGDVNLMEGEEKETNEKLTKNALAIIFNKHMEVLLLQRSSYKEQWMPNKYALVGGGVEEGEEPIDAIQREIKEEINIDIEKFVEKFVIQREDNVEHMFIAKYDGENNDVMLNKEHQDFGWYDINDINKLDIVPNLLDYVKIALTKYDE